MRSCKSVRGVELEDAISLTPSSRRGLASKVLMPSRPGDVGGGGQAETGKRGRRATGDRGSSLAESGGARFLNELAWPTVTRLERRVQSSGLGGLGRDPLSKCLRGEHLSMRSVGEEVVERMVDPLHGPHEVAFGKGRRGPVKRSPGVLLPSWRSAISQ